MIKKNVRAWLLIITAIPITGGFFAIARDVEGACSLFLVHLEASRNCRTNKVTVNVELVNSGQTIVYLFDDTLLEDAFQLRDGLLSYDISAPTYSRMAEIVLSKTHVQQQPKYRSLGPGQSVKRRLSWRPRNRQEEVARLETVLVRTTVSDHVPEGSGVAFAQSFGAAPSGCTREVTVALGQD